jgi:hypothetical protein
MQLHNILLRASPRLVWGCVLFLLIKHRGAGNVVGTSSKEYSTVSNKLGVNKETMAATRRGGLRQEKDRFQ